MKNSSKRILLLYKIKIVNSCRKSYIYKLLFGRKISFKDILIVKIILLTLYFLLFYLLPGFLPETILYSTIEFSTINTYDEFLLNITLIFILFFGMFVGANLVYEPTINENTHMLHFPITIKDLVIYRAAEAIITHLKFCFYFLLPMFLYIGLLSTSKVSLILLYLFSFLSVSLIFYFIGIIGILLLNKYFEKITSDRIFINIFLGSVVILIALIKIIKDNNLLFIDVVEWLNPNQYYINFSPGHLITSLLGNDEKMFITGVICLIIFQTVMLLLLKQTYISLHKSYKGIHLYTNSNYYAPKSKLIINYNLLNKHLLLIPLKLRPIIIKDILTLLRRPYLIFKISLFVFFIVILTFYHINTKNGIEYNILFLYFIPTYVVSSMYINSIGLEKSNIYLLKQIFPSPLNFLITRLQVNLISSFIILLPILVFYSSFNITYVNLPEIIIRIFLLILCIVTITLLVTGYSASFAVFDKHTFDIYKVGIPPGSLLSFYFVGIISTTYFYLLDTAYLCSNISINNSLIIPILGAIIFLLITVFFIKGQYRIKNI